MKVPKPYELGKIVAAFFQRLVPRKVSAEECVREQEHVAIPDEGSFPEETLELMPRPEKKERKREKVKRITFLELWEVMNSNNTLTFFLIVVGLLALSAVGAFIFEAGRNQEFVSFWDTIWWTVVTITTVGYGDKAPVTIGGKLVGILIMLGVLISGTIHIPMGMVADRVNKKRMVAVGGLVVIYSVWSFQKATGFTDLVLAQVLFGLGGGASMPALMAMAVSRGSKLDSMGSVMAILTVAHSLGMLLGSLLGGFLMDWFDLRWAFPIGAVLMIGCLAVFYGAATHRPKPAETEGLSAN